MSREIKFRVWDKKDNRLMTVATIRELVNMCLAARKLLKPHLFHLRDLIQDTEQRAIIEQYTGLKDNNDKDIYEGDVVRYVSEEEAMVTAVVKFGFPDVEAVEDGTLFMNGFYLDPLKVGDMTDDDFDNFDGDYEIIGNIHENPELVSNDK